jgi:hypothetical protein
LFEFISNKNPVIIKKRVAYPKNKKTIKSFKYFMPKGGKESSKMFWDNFLFLSLPEPETWGLHGLPDNKRCEV